MSLEQRIEEAYRAAMKARDMTAIDTYRLLRAALKQVHVDQQNDLTDDDVVQILSREARKRQEAAAEFGKSGRPDLAAKERAELAVIQTYLPQALSEDEVKTLVAETIQEVGATDLKGLGAVMKAVMPKVKGRADGQLVSRLVREALAPAPPPPT
ncbi:MAG: GatB/YqeY domain-containing protein [bacterium]